MSVSSNYLTWRDGILLTAPLSTTLQILPGASWETPLSQVFESTGASHFRFSPFVKYPLLQNVEASTVSLKIRPSPKVLMKFPCTLHVYPKEALRRFWISSFACGPPHELRTGISHVCYQLGTQNVSNFKAFHIPWIGILSLYIWCFVSTAEVYSVRFQNN